jgi:hypothetical protein
MATGSHFLTIPGLVASAAIAQYSAVKLASTAGQVKICNAVADECIGVIQNDPAAAGDPAEVAFLGLAKALVEASVAAGDFVGPSVTGRLKAVTTDNTQIIGYVAQGASATAGDVFSVMLTGIARY